MHQLIILAGHPGSGKTSIADALASRGFVRLSIDDFYQTTPRDTTVGDWYRDEPFLDAAYAAFEAAITNRLERGERIVVETSGVGKRWRKLLADLVSKYADRLTMIYLKISRETSEARIRERNATDYPIKITDEAWLRDFFDRGEGLSAEYEHVIDAERPLEEVITEVEAIIA